MWFTFVVFLVQLYRPGAGLYMQHANLGGRKLSEVWPKLNASEAFSGELYQTNIAASNLSEFGVQFMISKVGSQDLPSWLTYKQHGFNLVGLPLDSNVGLYQLFIIATQPNNVSFIFLGAQTFDITVRPRETHSYCSKHSISINFLLKINATKLDATERLDFYKEFTRTFNVSKNNPILFQEQAQTWNDTYGANCEILGGHQISLDDHDDPLFGINWIISCGLNSTWNDTVNNVYNITSTLGGVLAGYPITGWRIWHGIDGVRCLSYYHSSHATHTPSLSRSITFITTSQTSFHYTSFSSSAHLRATSVVNLSSLTSSTMNAPIDVTPPPSSLHYTTSPILSPSIKLHPTSAVNFTSLGVHITQRSTLHFNTTTGIANVSAVNHTLTVKPTVHLPSNISLIQKQSSLSPLMISSTANLSKSDLPITNGLLLQTSSLLSRHFAGEMNSSSVDQVNSFSVDQTSSYLQLSQILESSNVLSSASEHNKPSSASPIPPSSTSHSTGIPRNSDPIVNRKLPKLNITSCEYLFLEIPEDTFLDKEDGDTRNLTLQLLTKNFEEPPSNSWIRFDPSNNVVYGVPLTTQVLKQSKQAIFEYVLSAVDSGGRIATTTLTITVVDEPYHLGQRISIKTDAYLEPRSRIPLELVKLVSEYLYNGDNRTMKIINITVVSGSPLKVEMTWSDCKAVHDVCDVRRIERTSRLIRISTRVVNPQFMIALMPKFVVRGVSAERFGMCLNEPPLATRNVLLINITCCEIFHFQVPSDLFHDKEDGDARNLSLSLLFPNGSRLNADSWIGINDTSKTIEGVMGFDQVQTFQTNVIGEFLLVATDSGKLRANLSVHVITQHPLPSLNYHVTLIMKNVRNDHSSQLRKLFLVVDKLRLYFGDNSSDNVFLLSYRSQNLVRVITWGNSSLGTRPCDYAAIANISAKLKESDGRVTNDFKVSMLPDYEVQFVFEERLGHCKEGANEPPRTLRSVLSLHLNQSLTYFEYHVPVDTFHDFEDGNTRNLQLSLLSSSFDAISKNSWIVLEKQVIYGLPDRVTLQLQPPDGYHFILLARDRAGKITTSNLRVEIPRITKPFNYQITAQLRSYLDRSLPCVNHVVSFLRRINEFTGEKDSSAQVLSYNISTKYPADVTVSWSNRTRRFDTCDQERINEEFRMFSDEEGQATERFSDILLPFFIVRNLNLRMFGSCRNSQNHPPLVLTPVPVLNISIYRILEFQLPDKMFSDKEDGYTRNLTVVVLDKNDQTLPSSSWIAFNISSQTLYGLPTRTVARQQPRHGYVIKIVAMDTARQTVNTTMQIEINGTDDTLLNYEIKIKATVANNRTTLHIEQILRFFSKLESYLRNQKYLLLTNYTKENTTLVVSFSKSDFLGNKCEFLEIRTLRRFLFLENSNFTDGDVAGQTDTNFSDFVMDHEPSRNFTNAMAPDFVVTQVTEFKKGPCLNTPPVVFQPLPFFSVSTHGLFSIPIPPMTFRDDEDGFTSNLTVLLLSLSGKTLPPDSWLQFNQTFQEVYGVITNKVIFEVPEGNYSYLLEAQDVHGLQTNTSLLIDVPDTPLTVGLKLNMILRSNFSAVFSHVDILKQLLTKIAAYFGDDSTGFLNAISFERGSGVPSTDIVVWSNTTVDPKNCDLPSMREISGKVRQSDNKPISAFRKALEPEFDVLMVFEQRLGSCEDRENSAPQTFTPLSAINISVLPSTLHYNIPRNLFYDTEDGDTRNLTLSLYEINKKATSRNSSVQLNVPLQIIYGIFTANQLDSEKRATKRFVLVATDSGGKMASTFLEIYIANLTVPYNYRLNIQFDSYLSSSLADVAQLIDFQEKLNTFLALRDIHVVSYSRSSGYPARFEANFINTSTVVARDLEKTCDHEQIARISDVLKNKEGNPKRDLVRRFFPGYVVNEISVQKFGSCRIFRDDPPKLNKEIPVINISVCETLKYQIPSDTFLDKEDGNTRNLTLGLQNTSNNKSNISWILLDISSQTLYAILSVEIFRHQLPQGYQFKLTATDSHGSISETIISVFVLDNILVDSYRLTASARIPEMFSNSKHIIQKAIEFLEAIQRYLSGSISNNMRVINFTMSSSQVRVTWSNCSLGYSPCDYKEIESLRRIAIYERTLPQPKFIQALAPAFILESVMDEMRGPCLNKGPVTKRNLNPLTATLCERLQYMIPADAFHDSEDGYTRNLSLSLVHSDLKPLGQDFWLTFNESSQTINGYPNVEAADSQPGSGYEFILNAKDRHGLSTGMAIKVHYKKTPSQSTYEVTLVLRAQFRTLPNSVEQLGVILGKMTEYMKSHANSIRVHSFVRAKPTTSFLTWSNCTFPENACDVLGIAEASKRFKKSNGAILDEFREIFLPEFKLQFVFEQRLGPCLEDSNFPPKVKQSLETLIVANACGVWKYSVPPGLFYDEEEGSTRNLTISIKTSEFGEIQRNSWIQLDQAKQILYGFPELRKKNSSDEKFFILATDSKGKFGTALLETVFEIKMETYKLDHHVTIEVMSYVGETFPDVYHLRKFLEKLTYFLNVTTESARVVEYERKILGSGSKFSISWANCSGANRNSCDHRQIQRLREKLTNIQSEVNQDFSQAMLPFFVPTRVTFTKFGPCRDVEGNSPPKLIRPIEKILSFSGNLLWYEISKNTFIDDEDGGTWNLSLVLQFNNKTAIPSDYWLKFDNVSRVISGVLLVGHSWNEKFRLLAQDRHGNAASDVFEVIVEPKCSREQLSYQVDMQLEFTRNINVEDLLVKFLGKLLLYFQPRFQDRNFTIISVNQTSNASNNYVIIWSHTRACDRCGQVNTFFVELSRKFLLPNRTTRAEFAAAFMPEFVIVNISETTCTALAYTITVLRGGKEDRWLVYLVPMVTILIFLLFCFLFFIFRAFVSSYRRKSDTIILDEQPVSPVSPSPRVIHVLDGRRSRKTHLNDGNRERVTVVNEEFVANAFANEAPVILLDKRVSPSKRSLVSAITTEEIEPRVVTTPPLYSEAVLQLAPRSAATRQDPSPRTTRIEMKNLPIIVATTETPALGAEINRSYAPDVEGKRTPVERNGLPLPYSNQQIHASRTLSVESDSLDVYGEDEVDAWDIFDEEEAEITDTRTLRLPTPPNDVGMLRLPTVPKPLGNSPGSSLVNTPDRESQSSSPFYSPLQNSTPAISLSTINNSYYDRELAGTPSHVAVEFPGNLPYEQARTPEFAVRSPLGLSTSPFSNATGVGNRTYRGPQSPMGFPIHNERVPYVGNRDSGNNQGVRRSPNDLREVLGELRDSVNRELDRRNEVDKYLEFHMNKDK